MSVWLNSGGMSEIPGVVVRMDDYRAGRRRQQQQQPPLWAYCLACGTVATTAATGLSYTVTGVASLVVWAAVIAAASVAAGLAYDSALTAAAWAACRRGRL